MNKYQENIDAMWEEVEKKQKEPVRHKTEEEHWTELKREFYGSRCSAQTQWGIIDFDPESMKQVVGGEKLTYDEYLEIMKVSGNETRHYFELCYYDCVDYYFKGQIKKKSKGNICFERIYVSGIYDDGNGLSGKEEHVWMSEEGFGQYMVGDCLMFTADIYRYLKTGNGKMIDFGLKNPSMIKRIESYQLPTEDELLMQSIDQIICEVCLFNEHCYMGMCIANEEWRNDMRKALISISKK